MALEGTPIEAASNEAYMSVDEAESLAAGLPGLDRFKDEDSDTQAALLYAASVDVDVSGRWQGGKYDPTGQITGTVQVREFPRVTGFTTEAQRLGGNYWPSGMGLSDVWDWDPTANDGAGDVVVPKDVRLAVLYQCEWLLQPQFGKRLEAIKSGLRSQSGGAVDELYGAGGGDGLCERSTRLLRRFRLATGRLL